MLKETSASARRPENDRERLLISRSAIGSPAHGAPRHIHQADQAAWKKLHTKNERDSVDHHLRVLEFTQEFGGERKIRSSEQCAGARMKAADHGHAQER